MIPPSEVTVQPHPFEKLAPEQLVSLSWFLFGATFLVGLGMALLDLPLRNELCPNGIVSFEFAFDDDTARAIVASWSPQSQVIAGLGLGFDFLFLAVYSSGIGAVALVLSRGWPLGEQIGTQVAWLMWAAALCDGVENGALIQILLGMPGSHWAPIAGYFASVKFMILALSLTYVIAAWVRHFLPAD